MHTKQTDKTVQGVYYFHDPLTFFTHCQAAFCVKVNKLFVPSQSQSGGGPIYHIGFVSNVISCYIVVSPRIIHLVWSNVTSHRQQAMCSRIILHFCADGAIVKLMLTKNQDYHGLILVPVIYIIGPSIKEAQSDYSPFFFQIF